MRTKHIDVDCHIVRKKLDEKINVVKHVSSGRQLADFICAKLSLYDIHAPA